MAPTIEAGASPSPLSLRGAEHIRRRQGPPDPLQLELTDRLNLHGILGVH